MGASAGQAGSARLDSPRCQHADQRLGWHRTLAAGESAQADRIARRDAGGARRLGLPSVGLRRGTRAGRTRPRTHATGRADRCTRDQPPGPRGGTCRPVGSGAQSCPSSARRDPGTRPAPTVRQPRSGRPAMARHTTPHRRRVAFRANWIRNGGSIASTTPTRSPAVSVAAPVAGVPAKRFNAVRPGACGLGSGSTDDTRAPCRFCTPLPLMA